jgi:hypothetical protein
MTSNRASHQSEDPNLFLEAHALLAVGIDGTVVAINVNPENHYFADDASKGADHLASVLSYWPDSSPNEPGLYEFKGYTYLELFGSAGWRVVHRGSCIKVAC